MVSNDCVVLPTMVERREGNRWEVITFDEIREGDVFKFLDPLDIGVQPTYIATTDAEHCGPGEYEYTVEADEYEPA